MVWKGDFDWIELDDGTWEIYTRDRMIAHIAKGDRGWHVASDPAHTFGDADTLLRLIDRGQRDGFKPQDH